VISDCPETEIEKIRCSKIWQRLGVDYVVDPGQRIAEGNCHDSRHGETLPVSGLINDFFNTIQIKPESVVAG
jgi:hypothetical protein